MEALSDEEICKKRKPYESDRQAFKVAEVMNERAVKNRFVPHLCKVCGKWHVIRAE